MQNYQILDNRKVIRVSGADSTQFLQGLITNNITKASVDRLIYAMMLSPQGRFLTDFFILKDEDGYLLDAPDFNLPELLKRLNSYKLRAKIDIIDVSDNFRVLASPEKIDSLYFTDPRNKAMGFRKMAPALLSESDTSFDEYEKLRIKLKIPDAQLDFIYDKSFPLEFGAVELNAIDFLKGCYVGQEVTARTYHLGVIRKKLMNLVIEANALPPSKGTEITAEGQKIGIVLGINKNQGLALVNMDDYNLNRDKELVANNISIKLF